MPPRLVLASGSSSRLRLLRLAGFDPEVVVSGVDETPGDEADTGAIVLALAERKARAVAPGEPDALVLGCDSLLDLDGVALGKATSSGEALERWHAMRGRQGTLWTGHVLIDTGSGREVSEAVSTVVHFGTPTERELAAYVATGEPLGGAGAFTIEGRSAPFIEGVTGDPNSVMGLSLAALRRLLARLGVEVTDLWI